MGITRYLALLLLASLLGACNVAIAEEIDTGPAMNVARDWLALVDGGRYRAAWEAASERFRGGVEQVKWEVAVQDARAGLGDVTARKLRTALFTRTLPGAPDGEYVVIQYDSRFERRPLANEAVTTEREKDGVWRVSGYWIR